MPLVRLAPLAVPAALALLLLVPDAARALDTHAFVTTTDYSTGGLRRVDLDTRTVLGGEIPVCPDTRLRWYNGQLWVVNRFGCDNLQVVDPATFTTIHQFSTGNGSNPSDVAFANGRAYVSRYGLASLLVMDPATGATLGTISLAGFADADGIPEMDRMERVGPWLLVACQRLDESHNFQPTDASVVAVVDTRADTVYDVNPALPGTQGIVLAGKNPVTPFAFDPATGRLLIGCVGVYGALDGGIEWVDPVQMKSLGYAITEGALGGDVSAIAWNGAAHSYAIVSDASFNTSLASWSATAGARLGTVLSTSGFYLQDLALNDRGELWVADGDFAAPGLLVYRAGRDSLMAGPLDTGLPPSQITFDHATTDAAGVATAAARVFVSAPWPNPARSVARLAIELPRPAALDAAVYDLAGRRVRALAAPPAGSGRAEIAWDLTADGGAPVPSGIYFLRLRVDGAPVTRTLVVTR